VPTKANTVHRLPDDAILQDCGMVEGHQGRKSRCTLPGGQIVNRESDYAVVLEECFDTNVLFSKLSEPHF
jgi:hypothetical protein